MDIINIEIKARGANHEALHKKLMDMNADYRGVDHQVDTYYQVKNGRLKRRKGNIEHALIYYHRPEVKDLKRSDVILNKLGEEGDTLAKQLKAALGIKAIVDKKRRIYFIDNVKFHLDDVKGVGHFIEIEAIGKLGEEEKLATQCQFYMKQLGILKHDLVDMSYSDMVNI